MEELEQHYLRVGTEVSAKYRGAFCEAKIKSVKQNVIFRVASKKDGKSYSITEECINGPLKIGATVEAQFPDMQGWHEGIINGAKDKSVYTVEFDDGDVRSLSRGSLCLQGVRHFAESETLDHLPLTDPENFGTPVLSFKRKPKRKTTLNAQNETDDVDSDDQKSPDRETHTKQKSVKVKDEETDSASEDKKRKKWLADPLMGRLVLVEPLDKRKHWYPGVCVNPLCAEDWDEMQDNFVVVRSFKNGKLIKVSRCEPLSKHNMPAKVEQSWRDVLDSALAWEKSGIIPEVWRTDMRYILNADADEKESPKKTKPTQEEEKNNDFLEQLYKFMEDRGSPMNKTPILGYKDLDLFLLYSLVQAKGGFHNITQSSDWREIYSDLGIPKLTQAAGHHVKNAYTKYLLGFEEYLMSFKNTTCKMTKKQLQRTQRLSKGKLSKISGRISPLVSNDDDTDTSTRRASRRRKLSETVSVADDYEIYPPLKENRRCKRSKFEGDNRLESDMDDTGSSTGSEKSVVRGNALSGNIDLAKSDVKSERKRTNSGSLTRRKGVSYKAGDKLLVKYGKDSFKLYEAKVVDLELQDEKEVQYYVHYAGWNSRHDEWIKPWRIASIVTENNDTPSFPALKGTQKRSKTPTLSEEKKNTDDAAPSSCSSNLFQTTVKVLNCSSPLASVMARKRGLPTAESIAKVDPKQEVAKVDQFGGKKKYRGRIRRRSTSSSTPPPNTDSTNESKRAASMEKCLSGNITSCATEQHMDNPTRSEDKSVGQTTPNFPSNRRTSGRRSKSPAYLRDATLYGLTKCKRSNSSASAVDALSNNELPDVDDLSSETSSRSVESPSECSRASPLTLWTELEKPASNSPKGSTKDEKLSLIKEESHVAGDQKISNVCEKPLSNKDDCDEDKPCVDKNDNEGCDDDQTSDLILTTRCASNANSMEVEVTDSKDSNLNEKLHQLEEENNLGDINDELSALPCSNASVFPVVALPEEVPLTSPLVVQPLPVNAASSSKVLVENTPPTTPEASPQYFNENESTSSGNTESNSPNAVEHLPPSLSPKYVENKQPEPSDGSHDCLHKNKSKTQINGRRNSKSDGSKARSRSTGESDSEEDNLKSKHSKTRRRPKKKVKPDPPSAPHPVILDELSKMTPDERIRILQNKLIEMRKVYQQLKQEVSSIDRKRKRAKRREQAVNEQVLDKKCDSSSPSKLDSMSAEKIEMESDADSPSAIATSDASTILPFT
ncbi:unnamed protein product [Clavelina lepadiformis]|uniref:ARID domain-containing protein n=1 Tax=Clavelina lepadiformis TaxID=159417 RepID=A0ABP0GE35_CLALP